MATCAASQRCPTEPVILTDQEGTIKEVADGQQPLPILMTCEWRVLGGQGFNSRVELSFDDIALSSDCSFATFAVYDGPDSSSPTLIPESCGSGPATARVVSSGDTATVVLRINEKSVENRGIEVAYKIIAMPEPNTTGEIDCRASWQQFDASFAMLAGRCRCF